MTPVATRVSKSTLLRCYQERWQKYLAFRDVGQGKRCSTCATLDQERTNAGNDPAERQRVADMKREHIMSALTLVVCLFNRSFKYHLNSFCYIWVHEDWSVFHIALTKNVDIVV